MPPKKAIELTLRILFFIISIVYLYVVFMRIDSLKPFVISLPIVVLVFYYTLKVKKNENLILIAFLLTIVGGVFSVYKKFYLLSVVLFFFEHVFFIILINSYIRLKGRKGIPLYMLLFLFFFILLFSIIYGGVEKDVAYYIVLIYGITSFTLGAIAFANFLYKMNKANFLLLLGFFLSIASDSVYAIDLLDQNNSYYLFLAELLYLISYTAIYVGFTKKSE